MKAFNIIKTVGSQTQSAVLEFEDPKVTDGVIAGLDKLDLAGNKLSVQRIPAQTAAVLLKPTTGAGPEEWTTIVCLSNMTTEEDLRDDVSFGELVEDIAHECNKHGIVKFIAVPRTVEEVRDVSLVGKVFVVFTSCEGAHATLQAISGRKFNGKVVEASFISLQYFETVSNPLFAISFLILLWPDIQIVV